MRSEEGLPLSHAAEALALDWQIRFVEIDKAISESADRHLKSSLGISFAQAKVVASLAGRQFMTQVQLARRLNYDMGSLSRIIPRLIDAGIVMRSRHPDDCRCWCVQLTGSGVAMVAKITAFLGATDKKLISLLTEDEADIFIVLLKRLLVNSATDWPADVSAVALTGSPRFSCAMGAPA
ncbi:MarR family transcriptional regulator [Paraburkholderia sp. CNPSo 3155]|uniref:MarR family winged helix-turn-helix transcriptional regulator n=1 Tax=Paraburkholderia atlantica TaxID=2654982 RepID=UPI00128DFAD0|nr:MarR family transcriptional regulator [Paraburkholderia atlantica]MBB5420900.1 DNA-binding MarR family transcriptional regulator [Paraburkholderia atlantica]MPW10260.1 MarR family transcriptional regulator [Paraburkholderia atlantica]NUY34678.1 MarR family transcriptional regulator [Paraburkholderia atlantica]